MIPADLPELANRMTLTQLVRHYGVGWAKMNRWLAEVGHAAQTPGNAPRPVPTTFNVLAPRLTRHALAAYYSTNNKAVDRWLAETGITPAAAALPKPPTMHLRSTVTKSAESLWTPEDEAARVLRTERFVVYRCDAKGRQDAKGAYWRSGNTLLTGAELIARAARRAA